MKSDHVRINEKTEAIAVKVTEGDIRLGEWGSKLENPIAQAAGYAISPNPSCRVVGGAEADGDTLVVYADPGHFEVPLEFDLPEEAREFMRKFHEGGPAAVRPFKFTATRKAAKAE